MLSFNPFLCATHSSSSGTYSSTRKVHIADRHNKIGLSTKRSGFPGQFLVYRSLFSMSITRHCFKMQTIYPLLVSALVSWLLAIQTKLCDSSFNSLCVCLLYRPRYPSVATNKLMEMSEMHFSFLSDGMDSFFISLSQEIK